MRDLTMQKFGRLLVIVPYGRTKAGRIKWLCACECGKTVEVSRSNLCSGQAQSCGCLRIDINANLHSRHKQTIGGVITPEYLAYQNAKQRCTNPHIINCKNYGGRGIEFRFNSFEEWYAELGEKPEPKEDYSVDRKDNDGHYEVGNVRWAIKLDQISNRRPNSGAPLVGEPKLAG